MGGCVSQPKKKIETPATAGTEVATKPSDQNQQRKKEQQLRLKQEQQKRIAKEQAEETQRKRLIEQQKQLARKSVQREFNRYEDVDNDYEALGKKRVGIGFNQAKTIY